MAYNPEAQKRYRSTEKHRETRRRYRATEKFQIYQKQYNAVARKRMYGLTLEEYDNMVLMQNGTCAICFEFTDPLEVDHNHETGSVRALLCGLCNRMLGQGKDQSSRLRAGADYLLKYERMI